LSDIYIKNLCSDFKNFLNLLELTMLESSKIILERETIPRVNLTFMDNTHFEEIEMVKELGKLITFYQEADDENNDTHTAEARITEKLVIWLNHTLAHFERENKLMKQTNFPAFHIHSQEHEIALNRMKRIVRLWQINKEIEPLSDFIFSFWPNWFNAHVHSMDVIMARFAVMNGFNPQATV
jgi:hemerythrin